MNAARSQLKRRLRAAGLPRNLRPHSYRVLVVTDLLDQGVPLEDVQTLGGCAMTAAWSRSMPLAVNSLATGSVSSRA